MLSIINEWNPIKSIMNLRRKPGESASERMLRITKGSTGVPIKALHDKGNLSDAAGKITKAAQEG